MKTWSTIVVPSLLAIGAIACGGNVVVDPGGKGGSSTTTSTGASAVGGATSTSVTGTGVTGTSVTGTGVGTSATSTSSTSASSGGPSCVSTVKLLTNGGSAPLTALCDAPYNPLMSTTPIGYLMEGGPPPGVSVLNVDACETTAPGSRGVHISIGGVTGPGTYGDGSVALIDIGGTHWGTMGATMTVTVTKLGPVGDTIEGYLMGPVYSGAAQEGLNVGFSVCHVPDELVP